MLIRGYYDAKLGLATGDWPEICMNDRPAKCQSRQEVSRFVERKDLNRKHDKIALKLLHLKLEIQEFPGEVPSDPLELAFLKRK